MARTGEHLATPLSLRLGVCFALGVGLGTAPLPASDFDVVINELHYNPYSGVAADEFIELFNRGPTTVDLAGWRFVEGVSFTFPAGVILEPKEHLVVSPDAVHAIAKYSLASAVGNYTGQLDNGGEIVALANSSGQVVSRVHYDDEGLWVGRPDGLGPSLERVDPHGQPDLTSSWASSLYMDGTPGQPNSRLVASSAVTYLLNQDGSWRYRKGTAEASTPPLAWTGVGYSDVAWSEGPGGFGYGSYPFNTELTDMQDNYSTLYARGRFSLSAAQFSAIALGELALNLSVEYDDGFVAYLNGEEVARYNAANAGSPPAFNALADSSASSQALIVLNDFSPELTSGDNVLAIHALNNTVGSGDFFVAAELWLVRGGFSTRDARSPLSVNEVRATVGGTPGFIELYNKGPGSLSLNGHAIVDPAGHRFPIPAGISLAAEARRAFTAAEVGFDPSFNMSAYVLVRNDPGTGRDLFVDALALGSPPTSPGGLSFGRVPDGNEDTYYMTSPSQGAANTVALSTAIVINEIYFHPPFVPPGGSCTQSCSDRLQWIELRNRSGAPVDVAGWSITKGIELDIPPTPALSIPAGGYLVLASSKADFLVAHPGFDPAKVLGDWRKDLSHSSDTINLRDALGNRVDHVKYGDGSPYNDEEPVDGINDQTFVGSAWPSTADGTGRSVELVHPSLDNRDGVAWRASTVGGTPGAQNSAFAAAPAPVIGEIRHSPAVPRPTDSVLVTCRVSAAVPITVVEALWHRETGGAGSATVALKDDGLSGDGAANDGVYGGILPAQPDQTVIGFQVRARQSDNKTTTLPLPPPTAPYVGFQGPFFLYQHLAASPPINPSANYYIILAQADRDELESRPVESNVLLPCAFIRVEPDGRSDIRQVCGIRFRGTQTRTTTRKSYRIEFPAESRFDEIQHLNLNASSVDREVLVSDLFRRAGMPYPLVWTVNLTFQGALDLRYCRKEHMDGDYLERDFGPGSDSGNFYRAIDPDGAPREGDLSYYGEDPADYVTYYQKRTNKEENDYSDVIELCRAFDPAETSDVVFPDLIETLIDADEWARYFAIQSLISNSDGSIQTSSGEDYLLYRVPFDSQRPDAGKWILVPWDIEESFASASEPLFRSQVPAIRRFLLHPRFAPLYYRELASLRDGAFSRFETRQRFVLIDFIFGFGTIDGIDSYITNRIGFVDSTVPQELSAGALSTSAGIPIVSLGETWRYFEGTQAPSGPPLSWTTLGYNDASWLSGPTGIGYGDGDDATVLDNMRNNYSTVYARRKFPVSNPGSIISLSLRIDYDDGFVAYLNGVEVARQNAPGNPGSAVAFDALASGDHEAGAAVTIPLDSFLGNIVAGDNVLAVQALNGTLDSSDLSLRPELLTGVEATGGLGCGTVLYSLTSTIDLSGRANAWLTKSVKAGGQLASYNATTATWTAQVAVNAGDNTVLLEAFSGPAGGGSIVEQRSIIVRRLTRSPTSVSGNLAGNTTWTAAGGPYLLVGDVTVPAGSRLQVDPGTLILGQARASIIVRGEIQALGSGQSPILFRAVSCTDRWGGVLLDNTGIGAASPTHTFRNCDLEFGSSAEGAAGCIDVRASKVLVENSSFRSLTANAVDGTDARVEVRGSLFEKINEGVHCASSLVIILDSTFRGMVGDKDAIDFDLNGPGTEHSRIERCLLEDGSDDGIDLADTTVDIRDNVIRNISDKALSLEGNGPLGAPAITGNLIYESGSGIALKNGINITESHHNTVVGNQEGLSLFAKAGASDGGHGVFDSLIVWNNIIDVKLDALSTASISYSDVSDGVYPGVANISQDPRFLNVLLGEYSLLPGSPCIGTGKGGTDMGALPYTGAPVLFLRADADRSGTIDLTDVIYTLNYLFRSGGAPICLDAADANDDGVLDLSDPIYTLLFKFAGGLPPRAPYPTTGTDPTSDSLSCGG